MCVYIHCLYRRDVCIHIANYNISIMYIFNIAMIAQTIYVCVCVNVCVYTCKYLLQLCVLVCVCVCVCVCECVCECAYSSSTRRLSAHDNAIIKARIVNVDAL